MGFARSGADQTDQIEIRRDDAPPSHRGSRYAAVYDLIDDLLAEALVSKTGESQWASVTVADGRAASSLRSTVGGYAKTGDHELKTAIRGNKVHLKIVRRRPKGKPAEGSRR